MDGYISSVSLRPPYVGGYILTVPSRPVHVDRFMSTVSTVLILRLCLGRFILWLASTASFQRLHLDGFKSTVSFQRFFSAVVFMDASPSTVTSGRFYLDFIWFHFGGCVWMVQSRRFLFDGFISDVIFSRCNFSTFLF